MHPDDLAPLALAAARRHELTRAKAIQALRELDRADAPVTFASVAAAARISRSWLYTQPDIREQIHRLRGTRGREPGAIPASQRATDTSPRSRLTVPSSATSHSPTRTPGCAASSPEHSATSDHHGPDPVTIQPPETTLNTSPPSRQRHCPRRDGAGHSHG
jgi:hypothetical protein